MTSGQLPADHKAMLRRRINNDAEIKALRRELEAIDKKRRPIQFRIGTIRNQHRQRQVKMYLAETALRRQRRHTQQAAGGTGEARVSADQPTVSQVMAKPPPQFGTDEYGEYLKDLQRRATTPITPDQFADFKL